MASRKTKKAAKKKKKRGGKKGVLIAFLVLVILIAGAIVYLLTHLDFIVKTAIEKYGSQATQTAVRVRRVRIRLKEGAAGIEGLTVANPAGFRTPQAFSLGEIGVDIDLKSLKGEEIGIDEIVIRSPEIFVEINKENKNNLNEIRKNLPAEGGAPSRQPASTREDEEKKLTIRRILFTGAQIHVLAVPLGDRETRFTMPTIEMRNLRGTPAQIAAQVISRLSDQALAEVKRRGADQARQIIEEQAKSQIEAQKKKAEDRIRKKTGL
ncbi:MAG TPA: AsmA family protein [bacterium]|nr:AsmA family protein [bacterium]